MHIYFGAQSDTMIAGTVNDLNAIATRLSQFVNSKETEVVEPASSSGSAAPYEKLLRALRVIKRAGPIMISVNPAAELSVSGAAENLLRWVSHFRFQATARDGDHHHPESVLQEGYIQSGSLSTIIEVHDEDAP